jgi:hypothetical protein
MSECLLDDQACWLGRECAPTDFACQALQNNPQLFERVLGSDCRDEECSVRGRFLSELIYPALKACSDDSNGDRGRFADLLLDLADELEEVPKFVETILGTMKAQSIAHQAGSRKAGKAQKPGKDAEKGQEGGSTIYVYVDKRAEELYGPFPRPPCKPRDYACVAYHYPELHRYAVGTEGCYDEQCSKRGFRPAWILWPVLRACGQEASEDKEKFYSCVRGISSLLRSIAQQFR